MIAAAALLAACSTDEDSLAELELEEAAPPSIEGRAGSVLVEYSTATSNGVSVHAQFLDVRGVSLEAALDALDVWTPDAELDLDTCSVRVPPPTGEEAENVRLHMMDVGPITVSSFDQSIRLEGRRVPDLRSFSGVVYGNEEGFDFEEAVLPYQPDASYQIVAPGGAQAGGFHVTLQAPSVPEIEAVAGRYAVDDAPIDLGGGDLELHWRVAAPSAALFLDVGTGSPSDARLRCRLEDDGEFVLPTSILEQLDSPALRVTLRRIDSVSMGIAGIDDTSFLFATTDEVSVRQ